MKSAILIHSTHAGYKIGNIKSTIANFCTNNFTGSNDSSGRDPIAFQAQELFGFIKDEARSLIKNIKDTSTESSV